MVPSIFGKKAIESYFLEREMPYTKRRPFKVKSLLWTAGFGLLLFIGSVLFFGGEAERKTLSGPLPDYSAHSQVTTGNVGGAGSINVNPSSSFHSEPFGGVSGIGYSAARGGAGPRNHTANQVIRRGENGSDSGSRLPTGYGFPVKLLNAILSSNSASPVIAEVTQDLFPPGGPGTPSIPAGTKAIGNATFDDSNARIQLRFHTLVYPEGDQHSFQGIGLMSDGSAGLSGDYHSGETMRQVGGFVGNFVGGLAEGMKERTSGGQFGMAYEPGSIRNGLLNAFSQSASDGSRALSDGMRQTKPSMTLPAGQEFIIFLEHEYTP